MSILITHGYLLTGTGSNLYVNNLVRELVRKGKDVILVCQDFDPMAIDFINELYDFTSDNSTLIEIGKKETPFKGKCICYRPNLNGFLPVYVYDHYEGFEVKEFNSCSDDEVARYVDCNFKAMDLILSQKEVSVINTNHLVMFPYVAKLLKKKHQFKFVITVHGSALNFTVKKDKRFENYAIESLEVVDDIVVDSLHADHEMKEFLESVGMESLIDKMEIIPAGVDISSFGVASKTRNEMKSLFIDSIADNVAKSEGRSSVVSANILNADFQKSHITEIVKETRDSYDYRHIDKDIIEDLKSVNFENENVFFVGKYLWTKGIYLILLALPEIIKEKSKVNFIFAGFGPFREAAEVILNFLASKDVAGLKLAVKNNELFIGEDGKVIPLIEDILDKHGDELQKTLENIQGDIRNHVTFTGILNHAQLVNLLPAMDVLVATSVFPEAFGMVAIEAAACGVYPVVTYQSAFSEIADQVRQLVGNQVDINNVLLDSHAASNVAHNVLAYFKSKNTLSISELATFKNSLRDLVVQNYSWEGIASKYLVTFSN